MKVNISKYTTWWGPYQISEALFFWTKTKDEFGLDTHPDWVHNFGEKLSNTWLGDTCEWIESKKHRKEKVRVDRWDSWSADHTLSLIIVPVLQQLKDTKHGAPYVDDMDVPEHLKSTSAKALSKEDKNNGSTDEFHFDRWDWILDEMIWAFTQIRDDNWEDQYHTGEHDVQWKEIEETDSNGEHLSEMVIGPNDTHKFDKDGYTKHFERIKRGTTLFGRYYSALWD